MRISTFPVISWTRKSNLFSREFIFSYTIINLFIFPLQTAFSLLPLSLLPLNLALFSSVSRLLLILSLLARLLPQTDWIRLQCLSYLNEVLRCLDAFRCLTVILFPWFMKRKFFSPHSTFKFLFTSAAFLRYLSFLAVILVIDTSQFLFILTAKLMILSAIC